MAASITELLKDVPKAEHKEFIENIILEAAAESSGNDDLDNTTLLMDAGLDSLAQVELRNILSDKLNGTMLPATLFLDYPTIGAVADYILAEASTVNKQLSFRAVDSAAPLAVVGIACRYPAGSDDIGKFWAALTNRQDGIKPISGDRFDLKILYNNQDTYAKHGGFIHDIDLFDASFFSVSAQEAFSMDPQQRLILEVSSSVILRGLQHECPKWK